MILTETFEVARLFGEAGLRYWVFGGNGVELVLGEDIRPHDDLDVFVAEDHVSLALTLLEQNGFVWHAGSVAAGDVFYRRGALLLDLVPIDDRRDPPHTLGKLSAIALPGGFLEPFVVTDERGPVSTLTPAMHLAMKESVGAFYGLPPRDKDLLDQERLESWIARHRHPGG